MITLDCSLVHPPHQVGNGHLRFDRRGLPQKNLEIWLKSKMIWINNQSEGFSLLLLNILEQHFDHHNYIKNRRNTMMETADRPDWSMWKSLGHLSGSTFSKFSGVESLSWLGSPRVLLQRRSITKHLVAHVSMFRCDSIMTVLSCQTSMMGKMSTHVWKSIITMKSQHSTPATSQSITKTQEPCRNSVVLPQTKRR